MVHFIKYVAATWVKVNIVVLIKGFSVSELLVLNRQMHRVNFGVFVRLHESDAESVRVNHIFFNINLIVLNVTAALIKA